MQNTVFDLVVIGSGSAGLAAAETAARLGAEVALIEQKQRLGGECLHSGCIPSKAFINAAKHIAASGKKTRFAHVLGEAAEAVETIHARSENDDHLESQGIKIIHGTARFTDVRKIEVDGVTIEADRFIIATGSKPRIPKIDGLKKANFTTTDTFFKPRTGPNELLVVGAGPTGCELAMAMSQLGVSVTVLDYHPQPLHGLTEPAASKALQKSFERHGIRFIGEAKIKSVSPKTVQVEDPAGSHRLSYDEILIAAGRRPILPEGLEAAAVQHDKRSIITDSAFRTTNKYVYAIGDAALPGKFSHAAIESGAAAATHALFAKPSRAKTKPVPYAFFTSPEIAGVGKTREQLKQDDIVFKTVSLPYGSIDKAVADNIHGFITVHVDSVGWILGAHIMGANASELIGYFSLAMQQKLTLGDLAGTVLPYPTLSFGIKQLASEYKLGRVAQHKRLLGILRKLRP